MFWWAVPRSITYPHQNGIMQGHGTGWRFPWADGKWYYSGIWSCVVCRSQEEICWPNAEELAVGSSFCSPRWPWAWQGCAGALRDTHGWCGTRSTLAFCVCSTKQSRTTGFPGNSCLAGQPRDATDVALEPFKVMYEHKLQCLCDTHPRGSDGLFLVDPEFIGRVWIENLLQLSSIMTPLLVSSNSFVIQDLYLGPCSSHGWSMYLFSVASCLGPCWQGRGLGCPKPAHHYDLHLCAQFTWTGCPGLYPAASVCVSDWAVTAITALRSSAVPAGSGSWCRAGGVCPWAETPPPCPGPAAAQSLRRHICCDTTGGARQAQDPHAALYPRVLSRSCCTIPVDTERSQLPATVTTALKPCSGLQHRCITQPAHSALWMTAQFTCKSFGTLWRDYIAELCEKIMKKRGGARNLIQEIEGFCSKCEMWLHNRNVRLGL